MAKLGPPELFNFSKPVEWPMWQLQFDRFHVALKLNKDSSKLQVNSFLYVMGTEAQPMFYSFVSGIGRRASRVYLHNMAKFSKHFALKLNIIHDK